MSRAEVQLSFSSFFDKAACATVVDEALLHSYISSLSSYIAELESGFDPIDNWSVQELERASEFVLHNRQWVAHSDKAIELLSDAFSIVDRHKDFLAKNGLLPEYLWERPNNSFNPKPLRGSA